MYLYFKIPEKYNNKSIKEFIQAEYKISHRLTAKLKNENGILLNGTPVYINTILKYGDKLELSYLESNSSNIIPKYMPINIIYEDNYMLIVDKTANLPVHPSQNHHEDTLANGILYYFNSKNIDFTFRPVNRLDRETSGLVVIAKNQYIHQQLSSQISNKILKRKYLAIVIGLIKSKEGKIDEPIARKENTIMEREVNPNGVYAMTNYKLIKFIDNKYSLIELQLETGRTHQIRVHMSFLGHPILGDTLYGKEDLAYPIKRQALHSYYVEFIHPITKEKMVFTVALPKDMENIVL